MRPYRGLGGIRLGEIWRSTDRETLRLARTVLFHSPGLVLACLACNLLVAAFEGASMLALALIAQVFLAGEATGEGLFGRVVGELSALVGPQALPLALLGLVVLCQLLRCGLQLAGDALGVKLTSQVVTNLRCRLFGDILGMSFTQFARHRLGELTHCFDQVDQTGSMVQQATRLVTQLSVCAVYVAILLWLSWQLTAVAVLVIVCLFGPMLWLLALVRRSALRQHQARVTLSQRLAEYLQGFRLLRVFSLEAQAQERYDQDLRSFQQAFRRCELYLSAVQPVFESLAYLAGLVIFLLCFQTFQPADGGVAAMVAYTLTLYRLVPRVSRISDQLPRLVGHWPVLGQLARLLSQTSAGGSPSPPGRPLPDRQDAIHFVDVAFRYEGGNRDAVTGLSFQIPRGKLTALVGVSGAGKSTILNLVLGFYRPTSGKILIGNTDLAEIDPRAWRATLGVVDQEGFLFHGSVRENILLGKPSATDEEIRQAARLAGAEEFIQALPEGCHTLLGDRGQRLSGGQRQRLAIARALLRDPQVLILDEATNQLDVQTEQFIQQAIEQWLGRRTVICITHRLAAVAQADQILVLDDGRLSERGTHVELLALGGQYARLWRIQAEAGAAHRPAA